MIKASIASHLLLPSPLEKISASFFEDRSVELWIKRDELIHPVICGNKWRKLKGYLSADGVDENTVLVSFGGPYSNHLMALANVGQLAGIQTVGVIRSYVQELSNPILDSLRAAGMMLKFVSPSDYNAWQSINEKELARYLEISNLYLIPMGGTGRLALGGVKEIWQECEAQLATFNEIWLSVGSGGLLAGTSNALSDWPGAIKAVYPFKKKHTSWPGKELMVSTIDIEHITCMLGIKFGAFDERIVSFINTFYQEHQIWLDPIYTARTMMNLYERIDSGCLNPGAKILFYHSGGLSGITGYNHQYGCSINYPVL